jgi:hypothetical protein
MESYGLVKFWVSVVRYSEGKANGGGKYQAECRHENE